jgi:hypothetical protein
VTSTVDTNLTEALIFNGAEIYGALTGSSGQNEQNLYERMLSGAARFRMVLTA